MSQERLTTEQQLLVETKLSNSKKSILTSYILMFLLGFLGSHNYYIGRSRLASIELALFVFATGSLIGSGANFAIDSNGLGTLALFLAAYAILGFFMLFDLVSIPSAVRKRNNELKEIYEKEILGLSIENKDKDKNNAINTGIVALGVVAAIAGTLREHSLNKQPGYIEKIQEPLEKSVTEGLEKLNKDLSKNKDFSENNLLLVGNPSEFLKIAKLPDSQIEPYGEMSEIFGFKMLDDNASQKKLNFAKQIHGKTIIWTMPVREVAKFSFSDSKGEYTVYLGNDAMTGSGEGYIPTVASIRHYTRNDEKELLSLKDGDFITIKGTIKTSPEQMLAYIDVDPAIIWSDDREIAFGPSLGEKYPNYSINKFDSIANSTNTEEVKKQIQSAKKMFVSSDPVLVPPGDMYSFLSDKTGEKIDGFEEFINKITGTSVYLTAPVHDAALIEGKLYGLTTNAADKDGRFYPDIIIIPLTSDKNYEKNNAKLRSLKRYEIIDMIGWRANFSIGDKYVFFAIFPDKEELQALKDESK